jgi:hypothetical protein
VALRHQRLDLRQPGAEAAIALLGVEAEQLVLALGLGQIEPLEHAMQQRVPAAVGEPRRQESPRHAQDPRRRLGHDVRARRPADEQIGERAGELAGDAEGARALRAVGQDEVLAHDAAADEARCLGARAGDEVVLAGPKISRGERRLDGGELVVAERRQRAQRRAPPREVRVHPAFIASMRMRATSGRENSAGGSCPARSSSRTLVPDKMTRASAPCGHVFSDAMAAHLLQ